MDAAFVADLCTDRTRMIVRQPIFKRDKNIWGYELISDQPWSFAPEESDTLRHMVAGALVQLASLGVGQRDGKELLLNINMAELWEKLELSREGWQCVFCACAEETEEALQCRCGVIKISVADKTPSEIVAVRKRFKDYDGELLAADVPDWETFEGIRALGFQYFQGPFFSLPQIVRDAKLRPGSVTKLQLLRELNTPACEVLELADIIASDVSLSYRILQYINSASFGLRNQIQSIQQAISLLGLRELKRWATVVTLIDLDTSPKGEELGYLALQRARFLSDLSSTVPACRFKPETMFMLGLFSLLDAMLAHPMEEALEGMPLDEDVREGLCGGGNDYGDCLRMLAAVEQGNWGTANGLLERYGVCLTDAATEYLRSSRWAAEQLSSMK